MREGKVAGSVSNRGARKMFLSLLLENVKDSTFSVALMWGHCSTGTQEKD
jgi:hypothetical protein